MCGAAAQLREPGVTGEVEPLEFGVPVMTGTDALEAGGDAEVAWAVGLPPCVAIKPTTNATTAIMASAAPTILRRELSQARQVEEPADIMRP